MRRFYVVSAVAIALGWAAVAGAGDTETPDDSLPKILAISVTAKDKDSETLEKNCVAKLRAAYAGKNVLFLNVDISSMESRHQAKLLLNTLGLGDVWKAHGKSAGQLHLVDPFTNAVVKSFTAKDDDTKVRGDLDKAVSSDEDEGCGCSDGCGEGCGDGCGCDEE